MKRWAVALSLALLTPPSATLWGQCVMCFRTAAAQNAARARLMNIGIVLLGLPPFCILGGFMLLAWKRSQAFDVEQTPAEQSLDTE